jgi:hypothetical protein
VPAAVAVTNMKGVVALWLCSVPAAVAVKTSEGGNCNATAPCASAVCLLLDKRECCAMLCLLLLQ